MLNDVKALFTDKACKGLVQFFGAYSAADSGQVRHRLLMSIETIQAARHVDDTSYLSHAHNNTMLCAC